MYTLNNILLIHLSLLLGNRNIKTWFIFATSSASVKVLWTIGVRRTGQYEVSVCVQSEVSVCRRWGGNNSAVREVCLRRCEAWCHSYTSPNQSRGARPGDSSASKSNTLENIGPSTIATSLNRSRYVSGRHRCGATGQVVAKPEISLGNQG